MVEDIGTIITSLGLPSVEPFIALIIVILAIIGIIAIISILRPVLSIFPYTYPIERWAKSLSGLAMRRKA